MSVAPNLSSRIYALFVTVWLPDHAALVTVIGSSKVNTKSNVAASAYAPSVQSTDNKFADFKPTLARFLIATKISGSALALSLPVAAEATPGCITHPLSVALTNSRE